MGKRHSKLTEMQIKNAKPLEGRDRKLYDDGGLYLLVRKNTGTKVWHYPYIYNGKEKIYTIGKTTEITTAEARQKRDEAKIMLSQGIDPSEVKKSTKRANMREGENAFEKFALEWYGKQGWEKRYAERILNSLKRDVFAEIGKLSIDKVTRQDVVRIVQKIEKRGAKDVAQRVAKRCEEIFDYAILLGVCRDNPATGCSRIVKSEKVEHRPHLKDEQLPEYLNALDTYSGRPSMVLALKLLLLTFVRPGELRFAQWSEFDLDKAVWTVPAERMKMKRVHIVPLSHQAISLIHEIKKTSRSDKYLFPTVKEANKAKVPVISDVTLTKVLRELGYTKKNGKHFVPHGARGTASTILNDNGFRKDVVEKQLSHIEDNKVRAAYNHAEYMDERVRMMQWWADYLDKKKSECPTLLSGH